MRITRFVVLGAALALAPSVSHAASDSPPEKEQKAGAQQTFDAGSKLYDAHRYEEALAAFRASYQIVASPNSHLMIARTLRDLGKDAEAYAEYDAVAKEAAARGDRYESAGHAAQEERDEVRPKVALLTVKLADGSPSGVTVKIGDETLDSAKLGVALPHAPGALVVTASAPDGSSARSEATLTGGGTNDVVLTLAAPAAAVAPPPPPPAAVAVDSSGVPLRTWAYVAGGVGVVGLATFGIFGAMSNSAYNSLDSSCPNHTCPPGKQSDVDAGKRDQTIANVGLVVGVVGLGAGVTLFIVSGHGKQEKAGSPAMRVAVGPGSVGVDGRF